MQSRELKVGDKIINFRNGAFPGWIVINIQPLQIQTIRPGGDATGPIYPNLGEVYDPKVRFKNKKWWWNAGSIEYEVEFNKSSSFQTLYEKLLCVD